MKNNIFLIVAIIYYVTAWLFYIFIFSPGLSRIFEKENNKYVVKIFKVMYIIGITFLMLVLLYLNFRNVQN